MSERSLRRRDLTPPPPSPIAEERERRHKAELAALEAQMQAKLEALTHTVDEDMKVL